jgi:hypothetical protein
VMAYTRCVGTPTQEADFLRSLNETLLANQREFKSQLAAERERAQAAEAQAAELREQVASAAPACVSSLACRPCSACLPCASPGARRSAASTRAALPCSGAQRRCLPAGGGRAVRVSLSRPHVLCRGRIDVYIDLYSLYANPSHDRRRKSRARGACRSHVLPPPHAYPLQ